MAINIFEGSRRIALLLGSVVAVITVIATFSKSAYYEAHYSLNAPTNSAQQ